VAKTSKPSPVGAIGMSFAEILGAWDESRLALLLAVRPDLAHPAPKTLALLIQRAGSWSSVQQARWSLDRGAQQVLDAACLLAKPATFTDLVALLGGPSQSAGLSEALERLEARALVMRRGNSLVLAPGLAELRNPARLGPPAVEAFASQQASTLASIARRLGVRAGSNRAASMSAVVDALGDPSRIRAVLSAAPAEAAQLASSAATQGPAVSVPNGVYGLSDRSAAGWLVSHGLLAPMSWNLLVMPREVGLALRGGKPFPDLQLCWPEVVTTEIDQAASDARAAHAALRLVADVRTILDLWGRAEPSVLKDGGIGVRELKRAAKAIERTELEAAQVIEIAAAAGLVTYARPGCGVLPLPAYDSWLALDVPDRWTRLALGWLTCPLHPSLSGVLDDKQKPIPTLLPRAPEADAQDRREIVLAILLLRVPTGHGLSAECLTGVADWMGPDVWVGGPASPAMLRRWVVAEAELVGMMVDGALSSFGRSMMTEFVGSLPGAGSGVGSGAARGGAKEASTGEDRFRGAVESLAHWAPEVSSKFVVQADLTAVAPGELTCAVRRELELLADVESKGAATVYRFSEASLRRGFDAGRSATQITDFLEGHATRGVPQALGYLVGDLGRRFGTVRVGSASCYLRCEDPALLSEIAASRRTARLGMRQLAPTVLVSSRDAATTLDTLRSSGYLPAMEDETGALVVIDMVPRRADAVVRPAWRPPLVDPASLAAELRKAAGPPRAPAPPPPDPSTARGPGSRPIAPGREPTAESGRGPAPLFGLPRQASLLPPGMSESVAESLMGLLNDMWESYEDPDPLDSSGVGLGSRPAAIAKGRAAVVSVLEQAYDGDWMVRIGYTGGNRRTYQLSAVVVAVEDDEVALECAPRWDHRAVALDQIEWVRVLTEAEEESLP
jgi:hypothetical protein